MTKRRQGSIAGLGIGLRRMAQEETARPHDMHLTLTSPSVFSVGARGKAEQVTESPKALAVPIRVSLG